MTLIDVIHEVLQKMTALSDWEDFDLIPKSLQASIVVRVESIVKTPAQFGRRNRPQ